MVIITNEMHGSKGLGHPDAGEEDQPGGSPLVHNADESEPNRVVPDSKATTAPFYFV